MKDIIEHLSVEQIESLYEKTFGNPIDHYPSMEVGQMKEEIVEEHLSRDLSWDWLMPIVESCFERLDDRDKSADEIKRQLLVCNLKGVHKAVVNFIKEYNNE